MRGILKLFVFLFAFISSVFAAEYQWKHASRSVYFSTPQAACDEYSDFRQTSSGGRDVISAPVTFVAVNRYNCRVYTIDGYIDSTASVWRSGDTCSSGFTYNSSTGLCDVVDQCLSRQGQSTPFSKSGTIPDNYMLASGGYGIPTQLGCFDSCAASTVDQKCTFDTPGAYLCRGTAYFTGEACQVSTTTVDSSDTAEGPEPQTSITDKPCVFETQADGTQVCQSEKSTAVEGQYCGEVNGVKRCVDSKPTKNGITVDTTVDTDTNADGSSTTTKTDTATKIECSGVNSCSSTITTTTTTVSKDASGNTTNSNSNCTGEDCASDANSDQNGNGLDDCTAEGDCSGGGSVVGEDCGVPLDCQGDAIACAVLKQEKDLRCKVDELYDLDSNKAAIDQLLQGEQFQISEQEVQAPSFISEATSFLPKSCPVPESTSLQTGGLNVTFDLQPICNIAEALGPLVVMMATVFAVLYVGRAFGGA